LRELKPGFVLRDTDQRLQRLEQNGRKGKHPTDSGGDGDGNGNGDGPGSKAISAEGPWDPRALIQRLADTFYFYLFEDQLPLFVESVRIDSRVREFILKFQIE
jgi:hypothetical protein